MSNKDTTEFMKRGYTNPDGMATDDMVFRAMDKAGRPMSVAQLHSLPELAELSEQTIRRSINRLMKTNAIQLAGNDGPRKFYAPLGTDMRAMGNPNPKVIPYAGELMSVVDFLKLMLDSETDPFKPDVNLDIFEAEFLHWLRRRFITPVITAGDLGYTEQIARTRANVTKIAVELERIASVIDAWSKAPIWFEQYRDQIAFQNREAMKENAELYQLAWDYVKS